MSSRSSGLFVAKRPDAVAFPTDILWKLKCTGSKSKTILHLLSFWRHDSNGLWHISSMIIVMVILGRQTAVAIVTHWAMHGALISVPWTALSLSHSLLFHVRINTICRKVVTPPPPGLGQGGYNLWTLYRDICVHQRRAERLLMTDTACARSPQLTWQRRDSLGGGSPREARNWKVASFGGRGEEWENPSCINI